MEKDTNSYDIDSEIKKLIELQKETTTKLNYLKSKKSNIQNAEKGENQYIVGKFTLSDLSNIYCNVKDNIIEQNSKYLNEIQNNVELFNSVSSDIVKEINVIETKLANAYIEKRAIDAFRMNIFYKCNIVLDTKVLKQFEQNSLTYEEWNNLSERRSYLYNLLISNIQNIKSKKNEFLTICRFGKDEFLCVKH